MPGEPDYCRDLDTFFKNGQIQQALSALGLFAVDYVNRRALASVIWQSLGYGAEEMLQLKIRQLIHPDDRLRIVGQIDAIHAGQAERFDETFRIQSADSRWVWIHSRFSVLYKAEDGTPLLLIGHDQDVTNTKLAEIEKLERLNEIETIRQVSNDLSISLDLNETVTLILHHTRRVIAYDKASVQLLQGNWLQVIGCVGFKDTAATLKLRFKYPTPRSPSTVALQSRKPVICNNLALDFPDFLQAEGEDPILSWLGIPLIANNEVVGLLALDCTRPDFYSHRHLQMAEMFASHVAIAIEKACLYQDMQTMAITDSLTGVRNRHSLRIHGNFSFEKARRNAKELTVLMLDLDFFKQVNDDYGHDTGDVVLAETARLVSSCLRPNDLFIRYGGEEFLVVLYDTGRRIGTDIAERIRMAIFNCKFRSMNRPLSISIGVHGGIPGSGDSFSAFISSADKALYVAKQSGRNRVINSADCPS
ncbi:MAG: hypothetical protein A2087_08105 [Spirochaetes bacterium GWD1_61_31]|nr:MAG: hypothetical protein A2Y37_03900 [Spirochaetes bacterium GWB1_60_80]OHD35452.1 MAG: hypothetical protein A2004_04195 [Spirochaetes bacterium GWC1_61_12]OHD42141.1 MAG: hypothetical protein A2087_08105 [Spirochaetes bacterium GWD1_61_31]OHD45438.1 MAG: hypothetical protein A2Y35_06430 [Spirochaetes bacterium GWE1_60_18]OHD61520.1 MAG: hypothetical protein A2Y32_09400 [Spirochaetes bacterium GWF1_60_12]HAP43248.1 hypothetical protein [Spirochaetaceae bacterium]